MKQLVILGAAGAAGYWTYHAIRTGKIQQGGAFMATLAAAQVGGTIVAVASLLLR
ncbi:MAG TPA: hypothetical protein VIF11_15760 [Methylomirabilota bacterium]